MVTTSTLAQRSGISAATASPRRGVEWTGYLDDVRPTVARSWVSVAPLRRGGGTRLKILEAMALGTPVVATFKGAEGLDVTNGENILLADDPKEFAAKVEQVLRSPALRAWLAAGGRQLVEAHYDRTVVGQQLCAVVEHAAASE